MIRDTAVPKKPELCRQPASGSSATAGFVAGLLVFSCLSCIFPQGVLSVRCGEQWGEGRVGAGEAGARPGLVLCCPSFTVDSEFVHTPVRQTWSGRQAVVLSLPVLTLQGRKQEKPSLVAADKLQLSPPCSAAASPHPSSPGSSSEEEGSGNSSAALGLSPSQGPEAADSPCSRSPEEEKEEEDVLKYVREIFFS